MKIVILGGGVAAFEAAAAARASNTEAEIVLVSREELLPYRRPMLSNLLKDMQINEKTFFIKPESFYKEQNISVRLNTSCREIRSKELLLSDGSTENFDKLVVATGGVPCLPPLPGTDRSNVYTFRTYADLKKLDAAAKNAKSAVIIGGGVLGLELAESLLQRNMQVSILEMMPRIFSNRLDGKTSAEVEEKLSSIPKLQLFTGIRVKEICDAGVLLESGATVPGELVIFSAGSRPDLSDFGKLPFDTGRGIIVNSRMQTTAPDIFAAGDAAQLDGKCFGLYTDARSTGIIAGTNAGGGDAEFKPTGATPVRCFSFGLKLTMS